MDIGHLLTPGTVRVNFKCGNKKDLLRQLADAAAPSLGLEPQSVFEALLQRERLGTTGLGNGIAIPHARLAGLQTISGFFIRLASPIDFHSIDRQPVDLIFALFGPADAGADHLEALVAISRALRDDGLIEKLHAADSAATLYAMLSAPAHQAAA